MPYREKVAWLYLTAMLVTYGPYFLLAVLEPPAGGMPNTEQLTRLWTTAVAQVVILAIGFRVLRWRASEDARAPADERDHAIERRSMRVAYFVLIAGTILAGIVKPFYEGGWAIVNATIASIVIAELVHYGMAVWSYRRGWQ